jgi:hypothetical protein
MAIVFVSGSHLTLFAPDIARSEGMRRDLRRLVLVGLAFEPITLSR